jgi:hypothetical protein
MSRTRKPQNPAGVPKVSVPITSPIGASGLRQTGGYILADFLPQLQGRRGAETYTEMMNNDALLGALLFAIGMLLRSVEWRVEAADESAAAKKDAEEIETALFKNLTPSFAETMTEICTMFGYGFAPMEVVWTKQDGAIVPGKIALRAQETVEHWEFADDGSLLGMWQQDLIHPRVFIPADRLLLFRTETTLNNPEGRSILRSSYVSWMRKKAIEEAEGRTALRVAGLAVIRVPGEILTQATEERAKWQKAAEDLGADRQGSLLLPSDVHPETKAPLYNVEYVVAPGRRQVDMGPIIERIDKRIATSVLADFLLLGQQAVGSFALSSDKTVLFSTALGAWLELIEGVFNRQLLQRWWKLNGRDPAEKPKLTHGDIETPDLSELGSYIAALANVGMPLFPDENLENYLREVGGLPEASPEARAAADAEQEARTAQLAAQQATSEATVESGGVHPERLLAMQNKPGNGKVGKRRNVFTD